MGLFSSLRDIFSGSTTYNVLEGAPALTPAQDRGLALGAMYAVEGHLPINALTMEADARTAAKLAKGAWDTADAAAARGTYRYLLGGGHDGAYQLLLPYLEAYLAVAPTRKRALLKEPHERALRELPELAASHGLDPARLRNQFVNGAYYYGNLVTYGTPEPLPRSIVGWDAARVVHVSRIFVDAGFVAPDEAWTAIEQAVGLARSEYRSWEEYESAFRTGRLLWQMEEKRFDQTRATDDVAKFERAAKDLLTDEASPWKRLAW
ncbi:DUF1266 domain-containing protein [Streptomyces hyderabadensis]|uniref:DUF1266 domain-containing protein n=1 Tax=Streptomyces hyderabadensis TaxID=598549 RepID=A0ABP9I8E6_9ACTN|nr:DUF1266 domain-containing protein [Streptomyces hyderabadensis]